MKVSQLIAELQKLDPDASVFLKDWNEDYARPEECGEVHIEKHGVVLDVSDIRDSVNPWVAEDEARRAAKRQAELEYQEEWAARIQ